MEIIGSFRLRDKLNNQLLYKERLDNFLSLGEGPYISCQYNLDSLWCHSEKAIAPHSSTLVLPMSLLGSSCNHYNRKQHERQLNHAKATVK